MGRLSRYRSCSANHSGRFKETCTGWRISFRHPQGSRVNIVSQLPGCGGMRKRGCCAASQAKLQCVHRRLLSYADSSSRRPAGWSSSMLHTLVMEMQLLGSRHAQQAFQDERLQAALLCQHTALAAVPLVHCCVVHLCHHSCSKHLLWTEVL